MYLKFIYKKFYICIVYVYEYICGIICYLIKCKEYGFIKFYGSYYNN